jgi:hypothetical protein
MVVKAIGGWINYILMKSMKLNQDHYVGDKSLQDKETIIGEAFTIFDDPISVAIDGSSHDSH